MLSHQPFNRLAFHEPLWASMQPILQTGRIAPAWLWIGPRHANVLMFIERLVATLLCKQQPAPCGHCQSCRMVLQRTHPDVQMIRPEQAKGPIKVDQIRLLQHDIYQTPQCGERRFVILDPADKLNRSAANALLKILEEPPEHTVFMLIAEHISLLPATILSRCQRYVVPAPSMGNELESSMSIAACYDKSDERAVLFQQRFAIMTLLHDLIVGKTTPCHIAAKWVDYQVENIIWFLYLLTTIAIKYRLLNQQTINEEYKTLYDFAQKITPEILFKQLDDMQTMLKKIQQNIALNQSLVLERLLLGYLSC